MLTNPKMSAWFQFEARDLLTLRISRSMSLTIVQIYKKNSDIIIRFISEGMKAYRECTNGAENTLYTPQTFSSLVSAMAQKAQNASSLTKAVDYSIRSMELIHLISMPISMYVCHNRQPGLEVAFSISF